MIIVKLYGGLGNQMFQYATAKSIAERHASIVKLDVSGFETYKLHKYSLHCFQLGEYIATKTEINDLIYEQSLMKEYADKFLRKTSIPFSFRKNYILENKFEFNECILAVPDNVYIEGYWQSAKYFSEINNILRREFVVKYRQDADSRSFFEKIQNSESVSLHVRRADYVTNPMANKIHGTCDQQYYDLAIRYIQERIDSPHIFLFSDEPDWARNNLKFNIPVTIVDCNDSSRNYEDLRLMSHCRHNIIANSSFSWWGAWLNQNPSKIVCVPKNWFRDASVNTEDLIPEEWIRL